MPPELFNLGSVLGRIWGRLPLIVSAALFALALHWSRSEPWLSLTAALTSLLAFVPTVLARWRLRRMLRSGDVQQLVEGWRRAGERVPQGEMIEPVLSAIAFAAYGWVQEARVQLQRARLSGPQEATIEHRLFVETLLEAFDGDRSQAMLLADKLASLPLPAVAGRLQAQVLLLRTSLGALARAFAHKARMGDLEVLEHAAQSSPLVSWAMRYAAAIIAIDSHQLKRAQALLRGAPAWPPQSAFREFHAELMAQLQQASSGSHAEH